MTIAVRPWPLKAECPLSGFTEFKAFLNQASYHNAAETSGEAGAAKYNVVCAAQLAVAAEWPYWAMERMFREIQPLVAWDSFMQHYINTLRGY